MTIMRVSSDTAVRSGLKFGAACALSLFVLLFVNGPALGLWLPWAGEEDKIRKTLNDIWKGLIEKNDRLVAENLTGTALEAFVNQERDLIDRLKIEKYDFRINSVQFDSAGANWAFVDLEKVATLKDGSKVTSRSLTVLQRSGGEWRLVTGIGKHRTVQSTENARGEDPVRAEAGRTKSRGPAMNIPASKPIN